MTTKQEKLKTIYILKKNKFKITMHQKVEIFMMDKKFLIVF